jgi:hypothetical protein
MTMPDTAFDPAIHGFRFPNRFPGGGVIAEINRQGRLSELTGVGVPRPVRHLADLAQHAGFWGTFGLCGGMSWAALDRFFQGRAPPAEPASPRPGSELFSELVVRQVDSMRGQQMIARCLTWQLLPLQAPWWLPWTDGVHEVTGEREWPALKRSLDREIPASLTLIRASGVADPSDNHQVVATGYEIEAGGGVTIRIYDPNHPRSGVSLRLRFDSKGRLTGCTQTTGEPIRGFFVWAHRSRR